MKISFDINGMPENPTLVLAYKNGRKIGEIQADDIILRGSMINPDEIHFKVEKYKDNRKTAYWDMIVDFRLVWHKESDTWFEATVQTDETNHTIKQVTCQKLSYAELSQINISAEINTPEDIEREQYEKPTILYDPVNTQSSLIHRIMEKAPHYQILHVDNTIADMQRVFSFNDVSMTDAFSTIAKEIGCLFALVSDSYNGKIRRGVSIYDLQSNCKQCGHRGEYTKRCPECGSIDIAEGYGEDTTIFVTSDELAESLQFTTNKDAVKNCFKLVAGDDLMTATIRNCNPNGSEYIWYISDAMKEEMSDELVLRLGEYQNLHQSYQNEYIAPIQTDVVAGYNQIATKYRQYDDRIELLPNAIVGYPSLMTAYYNAIDLSSYLTSELMPNAQMDDTNAAKQALLLNSSELSPVAVINKESLSLSTVDSMVLSMAKVVIDSRYRVKINQSTLNGLEWTGNFSVINYSDEDDSAISSIVRIEITDDYERFIRQKIDKAIKDKESIDMSIDGLFDLSDAQFEAEIKKYCLNRLLSFKDACQACIDLLIENGITDGSMWEDADNSLYDSLYVPYRNKLSVIDSEIQVRENEINAINGQNGLLEYINRIRQSIQNELNYETFLGRDLWLELCAFRRDQTYSNNNYISDGLNNTELFRNAFEFFQAANEEIYKSANLQHSIVSTLTSLLLNIKFRKLLDMFETGNWLRVMIDDRIYKLRLLEYEISFNHIDSISVEFSDVLKTISGDSDQRDVISRIVSISTSYDAVARQASQGAQSGVEFNRFRENGLSASNQKIVGADNETQTWDSTGMLFRSYDPMMEKYDDEQMKIIHSTIAITDDNWQTTKTAIGKVYHQDPQSGRMMVSYGVNADTLIGKVILGQDLGIYNKSGNLRFNEEGLIVTNGKNTVTINPDEETSVFNIQNDSGNVLSFNDDGDLIIIGNITAKSLTLLSNEESGTPDVIGLADVAISGKYDDLLDKPNHLDIPINHDEASYGQYLIRTDSGSEWASAKSMVTATVEDPVSGKAVFEYALPKNLGVARTEQVLYTDVDGNITTITIDDLKSLLGIVSEETV